MGLKRLSAKAVKTLRLQNNTQRRGFGTGRGEIDFPDKFER
jgi:hypothetical protein